MTFETESGWEALAGRVRGTAPAVSEFEVARLRSRVRAESAPASGWRNHGMSLAAGLAATVLLAVSSVAGLVGLRIPMMAERDGTPLQVARSSDGSVVIRYQDGTPIQKVVSSTSPANGHDARIHSGAGQQFVDRQDDIRPGTVVFYRVD
ncbi:MAG: hypothetical protein MUF27_08160 [Acidobacteria bacterium]|jgi:hypothetical protein|nr:hypothetical protein [Acidobacteriota bacterium]